MGTSSIAAGPNGETLFATAAQDGASSTYRSQDGGATWTPLSDDALRTVRAPVQFATDASHAFASTGDGHILETRDHGETWSTVRSE